MFRVLLYHLSAAKRERSRSARAVVRCWDSNPCVVLAFVYSFMENRKPTSVPSDVTLLFPNGRASLWRTVLSGALADARPLRPPPHQHARPRARAASHGRPNAAARPSLPASRPPQHPSQICVDSLPAASACLCSPHIQPARIRGERRGYTEPHTLRLACKLLLAHRQPLCPSFPRRHSHHVARFR